MRTIYYKRIIKANLETLGRKVIIHKGGECIEVWAVINNTRQRTKSNFEDKPSEIGRYYNEYYSYIGPAEVDITKLGPDDYFEIGESRYTFVQGEGFEVAGEVLYYEGIIKKIWEEEDVFV